MALVFGDFLMRIYFHLKDQRYICMMILLYDFIELKRLLGQEKVFSPQSYSLLFVKKGSITLSVDHQQETIKKEEILIISPHIQYELIEHSETLELYLTQNYRQVQATMPLAINRFQLFPLIFFRSSNVVRPSSEAFFWLWNYLEQLLHFKNVYEHFIFNKEVFQSLAEGFIMSLASVLKQSSMTPINKASSRKEQIAEAFLNLSSIYFKEHRSLSFFAEQLHVSIKYLSICVKEVTGMSPSYILNQLTIDQSKFYLKDMENNVADVAYELNFADSFIFSKFFKRHTGQSPSEYRKSNLEIHTI